MYLRHTPVRRKGKTHTYWKLVRSVRQGGRVRQEVVAHLGRLDGPERRKASSLARHFLGRSVDQPSFFEDDRELPVERVRLGDVRVERSRGFGDVWLGWLLWGALGLDEFCQKHMPRGREHVPWHLVASILVIARLCEPSSELHIAEDWYRRTALEDILGVPDVKVHHKRLYQALDRLVEHKDELWKTLEGWQSRAGLGNSPRTIIEEMARVQCVDVVMPIEGGPEIGLRCVAQPDRAQAALLDRLGLSVPRRLRVPDRALRRM